MDAWLQALITGITQLAPDRTIYSYDMNVRALLAILLIGISCGSVGSLVVGNRMAFFSDALAHCAFAGVGFGVLIGFLWGADPQDFRGWLILIMVAFGILVGLGIAFVRQNTAQSSDTVIGVFFAGAIGLGAIFLKAGAARRFMPPEDFLFGNLVTLNNDDILHLLLLTIVVAAVLYFVYNALVFASFSPTLGRSRGIRTVLLNYLLIVVLAILVNVCLLTVGALLINAMLIVPAAAAANLCRNMRQLFPCAIGLCVFAGIAGQQFSWVISTQRWGGFSPGESGTIVVVSVLCYFASIIIGPWLTRRRAISLAPREKALQN
jgi:zinc transport system permease protein